MAVRSSFRRRPTTNGAVRRRRERHAPPGPPPSSETRITPRPGETRELAGAAALELQPAPGDDADREVSQR